MNHRFLLAQAILSTAVCALGSGRACADTVIYQDSFTTAGVNRGGPYTSSLGGTAPSVRLTDITPGGLNYSASTWTFAAETNGWGQTGAGYATPTSSNYLPFTPVAGAVYTLTATIDATAWNNSEWFTIGFTSIPGNWVPGNLVADLANNLVRGGNIKTVSVTLDTTAAGWTNTQNLAYAGWFTDVPGNPNLNPANPEVKVSNFALTTNYVAPSGAAYWSGETNGSWDNTTVNFTGQSFGTFKTAGGLAVIFADADGNSNPVTRNDVTITAGGVSIANANFRNNALNYTLNCADATGLTGDSNLTKTGSGTLTLTGPNTYTGATIIANGTVILSGGADRLPAATALTLGGGPTSGLLKLNGNSQSLGSLASIGTSNQIVNGSATPATLTVSGSALTSFAGKLGGSSADEDNFSLVKSSASLLELASPNNYSGGTAVNGGTLVLANPTAAGSGNIAVTDAAILAVSTTGTVANAIDLAGGPTIRSLLNSSATLSGNITNDTSAGTVLVDFPSRTSTLALTGNSIDLGTKSLVVQGPGASDGFYDVNPSLVINGSAVAVGGDTAVGRSNLTIQGGSLTTNRLTTPAGAGYSADWGKVNINAGTLTVTNGVDGSVGTGATFALNLNGGELRTPSIRVADREAGTGNNALLTFNGGKVTVIGADNANFITLYGGNQNSYVGAGGAVINTNSFNIGILVNLLDQGGGLTKQGAGTLTLSGTNTYSGNTTVEAGSLVLASGGSSRFHPTLNNTSNKLTGAGNPAVNLDGEIYLDLAAANLTNGNTWLIVDVANLAASYGGTFSVNSSLGAFTKNAGVWTLPQGGNVWTFTQATGQLDFQSDPFLGWINATWPTLSDKSPTGDPDHDGIPNLLEYVLRNGDPSVGSTAILPTSTTTATDFVFTFYRRAASTADTTQIFQYSVNLTNWTPLAIPGGTGVVVTDIGGGIDEVVVTVPRGSNTTLFGRLVVTEP